MPWLWRGMGMSRNLFFLESFIDEPAVLARRDPLEFRRLNLENARALARLFGARQRRWPFVGSGGALKRYYAQAAAAVRP